MAKVDQDAFVGTLAITVFAILLSFYVLQIVIAITRSLAKEDVPSEDGSAASISLLEAATIFDGGYRNIWTFFALVIFVPVFLTAMGDIIPLVSSQSIFENMSGQGAAVLYYMCVAIIGVLITLEFSYIHNLRRSAPEWISMLIVALALDFATLMSLHLFVQSPQIWVGPSVATAAMMGITTAGAMISTFTILVIARTAGALADGQIIVPSDNSQGNGAARDSRGNDSGRSESAEN